MRFAFIRYQISTSNLRHAGIQKFHVSKVHVMLLCFHERPTLVLVLLTKRNLQIFDFMKKEEKQNSIQSLFCSVPL